MTPCRNGNPDFDALAKKGKQLVDKGMRAVVYCGSMGDWPLLTTEQRQKGVEALTSAGVPVVVGTGAANTMDAVSHASHGAENGASGLMLIPRVLSRGTSVVAQTNHFQSLLSSAPNLPSVIYNSPYYGFQTRAELFFNLRAKHSNLVGFKEFGGRDALTYAAENITSGDESLTLMVGVDTQVFHGYVNCGAKGAITGIGNALPEVVLLLLSLCEKAAAADVVARRQAYELDSALHVLSTFDEGPDLVLYYKYLMVLNGDLEYESHFNSGDKLSSSQRNYVEKQYNLFNTWFTTWCANENLSTKLN